MSTIMKEPMTVKKNYVLNGELTGVIVILRQLFYWWGMILWPHRLATPSIERKQLGDFNRSGRGEIPERESSDDDMTVVRGDAMEHVVIAMLKDGEGASHGIAEFKVMVIWMMEGLGRWEERFGEGGREQNTSLWEWRFFFFVGIS